MPQYPPNWGSQGMAMAGPMPTPHEDAMKQMHMASMMALWTTPFMPNLLNTAVFLVETSQCIAVLLVNYKGRPFMKGMLENHPLFLSVFACVAMCVCCAWGVFPELNTLIHLEPFPDDAFRFKVIGLVLASLFGTFLWDRLCTYIWAPRIFQAMMDEAKRLMVAYMPYKIHAHRIFTDLNQPWVQGYHRNIFVRDFFKYVDIESQGSGRPIR
jgi:hypothetical protein